MTADRSEGWEAVAERFMAIRSGVGAELVLAWAKRHLPPSAAIVDVGCGSGVPIARALVDDGFVVSGIDASPALVAAYRRNLPDMLVACEAAQDSALFGRTFAGVVSIGLVFLLDAADQRALLSKIADALTPGGRFLFSAPREICDWRDTLTDRTSVSLGKDAYRRQLDDCGLHLAGCLTDEGGNNYYDVVKPRR